MPLVGIAGAIMFAPWNGVLAWIEPLPDTLQEQVEAATGHGLDGIIVYVDRGGRDPEFHSSGWKDRAGRAPADPQALFKIGSISKLYVAAAAAKLASRGELSLESTLADRLPDLVGRIEHADRITVKMLLQHRSGIPSYTDHDGFDWSRPPAGYDEAMSLVLDKPARFAPGAEYGYSNTNYTLLGRILDDVLGYGHQRYVQQEILEPLGLTSTYGSLRQADLDRVVSGYHRPYDIDFKDVLFTGPGGAMVATAQDVGIFLRALNDGSLLSDEEQAVYSSVYEYGHKGWVLGYQSIARYHEDIDAVVVQFVNTTGKNSELTTKVVYDRIVRILRGQARDGMAAAVSNSQDLLGSGGDPGGEA